MTGNEKYRLKERTPRPFLSAQYNTPYLPFRYLEIFVHNTIYISGHFYIRLFPFTHRLCPINNHDPPPIERVCHSSIDKNKRRSAADVSGNPGPRKPWYRLLCRHSPPVVLEVLEELALEWLHLRGLRCHCLINMMERNV